MFFDAALLYDRSERPFPEQQRSLLMNRSEEKKFRRYYASFNTENLCCVSAIHAYGAVEFALFNKNSNRLAAETELY